MSMSPREQEFVNAVKARKTIKVNMPSNVSKVVVDENGEAPRSYNGVIAMIRHSYTNYDAVMKLMSTYVGPAHLSKEQRARGKYSSEDARSAMQAVVRAAIEEQARKDGVKIYVR